MIRHWVEAMGDENPVYTDPEAAAASVHGRGHRPARDAAGVGDAWASRRGPTPRGGVEAGRAHDAARRRRLHVGRRDELRAGVRPDAAPRRPPPDALGASTTSPTRSTTGLGVGHFVTHARRVRDDRRRARRPPALPHPQVQARHRQGRAARAPRPRPTSSRGRCGHVRRSRSTTRSGSTRAKEHRLLIQRCASCEVLRHPPRPRCDRCGSYEWDTRRGERARHRLQLRRESLPAGRRRSTTRCRSGSSSSRRARASSPTSSASSRDDIEIGMAVAVEWMDHDDDLTLPAFRPARERRVDFSLSRGAGRGARPRRADLPGLVAGRAGQGRSRPARTASTATSGRRSPTPTCSASRCRRTSAAAGSGSIETCLLLEQQGRVVAPVPFWATVVLGALPIAASRVTGRSSGSVAARCGRRRHVPHRRAGRGRA